VSNWFDVYQAKAKTTAIYPESGSGSFNAVSYAVLGLANEAGEVGGKLKKVWRDFNGHLTLEKKAEIAAELGDVLWYVAAVASEIGYDLSDISTSNLDKLESRAVRGVIGGSGDNR
jgi:NTP pyrophosphatase (non-canonical NTP hydrolase)